MAAPTILPGTSAPLPAGPSALPARDAGAGFDACLCEAGGTGASGSPVPGRPPGEAAAGTPSKMPADGGEMDEAAFQEQMFSDLTDGVDADVRKRLSKWLPDVLNGGKGDLKETAKGLSKQDAADLDDLAEAIDLKHDFGKVKDRGGPFGNIIEKAEYKNNRTGLEQIKRAYGEQTLKASTPALAPAVSYDTGSTLDASRDAVYENFVSGLSEAKQERLAEWLPDVLFGDKSVKKAAKKLDGKDDNDLKALAKEHGIDIEGGGLLSGKRLDGLRLGMLETAFKRDLALDTTGELPSVVDMLLAEKFGKDKGDTAAHIDLKDDKILKEAKAFKQDYADLDDWLPGVLAGRGEMPEGDEAAKKLLVDFAEEFGFDPKKSDALTERADKALKHLDKQDVIGKTLHPGRDGEDSAFLLFTDRFMESTLAYGAKNGAIDQPKLLDAANVAEMLLGPDDGTDAPRDLEMAGLQAAILHRTDEKLSRPQEVMAASGYINAAETLSEQKTRLTEVVLAFHIREEIGTPPMTPLQWAENYADLNPEMLDDLGNLAFNAPTGEKMQTITQHLGVPGEHKFNIDKRRTIKIENDDLGNLEHFDRDKKKKPGPFEKFMNVAVPVIGTVLSFVPGAQPIGMGINMAFSAYKGAEAIKHGDLAGGLLGIATSLTGARMFQVASGALQTVRAIESKDWMGALAGGLGTVGMASDAQKFQTAATGINTAQAVKEGDFLQAGAGMASLAGDAATYSKSSGDSQFAFRGLEQGLDLADGIQEKNYAGIGNAAAGLISTGHGYDAYRDEQAKLPPPAPEQGAGGTSGETVIRPAGYTDPNGPLAPRSIEVAGGDTLSQIAARHGTTVEALMAANPGIGDPNRIHAGQQLTLPEGVQSVGAGQQDRLREFADSQGGPSHLPSPPRPGEGDPMLQPGATHPNATEATAMAAYQRDFDLAVDTNLSSINEQIADIDRQLEEGVNHAPVEYHLKNERLKLQARQREFQALADSPNAAFDTLDSSSEDKLSEVEHFLLDGLGVLPFVGDAIDIYHAGIYAKEGRPWDAAMTIAGATPGVGPFATIGKWLGKGVEGLRIDLGNPATKELVDDLAARGIKHTPENIIDIRKTGDGQTVFLEVGNKKGGLTHVLQEHAYDFSRRGVEPHELPDFLMTAVTEGKIIGYQGKNSGRAVYRIDYGGRQQDVSISVGDNGFIVGANPAPKKFQNVSD